MLDVNGKVIDEKWLWQRNVIDKYKPLSNEEIKADLQKNALPFSVLCTQIKGDFNFGNIVRTGNAFGAREIFYHGPKKHWDRRGSLCAHVYLPVKYLPTIEDIKVLKQQYRFVGLENNINRTVTKLQDFVWKPETIIVVGEECCGLSDELLDLCDDLVEISQAGSIRSLNVATAAALAMWECVKALRK